MINLTSACLFIVLLSYSTMLQGQVEAMPSRLLQQAQRFNLDPSVLKLALRAYQHAKHQKRIKKDLITIVDYSLHSSEPRLWVVDVYRQKILYRVHVAHGKGSGVATAYRFSNQPRSYASSIGVYITGDTYKGNHGYSLNLHGLESGFNSNAYQRRVVMHEASYATASFAHKHKRLGRSHGCLAVDRNYSKKIINKIAGGSLIFNYYPQNSWLTNSVYLKKPTRHTVLAANTSKKTLFSWFTSAKN